MHAFISNLTLVIRIPFSDAVRARRDAAYASAKTALEGSDFVPSRIADSLADEAIEKLDWAAVRSEMNRKAKKSGVLPKSGDFPVNIFPDAGGITLSASFSK